METKPMCIGTLYSLIKPVEKAAAQKGSSLTLASFEARGQAGKHGHGFEHPQGHPTHSLHNYILTTGKAGAKNTTSGNFFCEFGNQR